MGLLKEAGVRIPAIRRLHDSRNALLAERDDLRDQRNALSAEQDALRSEYDAEVRAARADGRLVIAHYPYRPSPPAYRAEHRRPASHRTPRSGRGALRSDLGR